jgi:tripartite-type tricarboxylate transporter receptor subunit TctC
MHLAIRSACAFAVAVLVLAASFATHAADYPSQTIKIVVPFPPGGGVDVVARVIAPRLGELLGQSVIIENRGGAGGSVGATFVAQAPRDGYTLLMGTASTHGTNPNVYTKLGYDPVRDFAPVALITSAPLMLVANNDVPVKTAADLVALAKAKPGTLTFGTIGPGSSSHLATELFKLKSGIDMLHVPFKGLSPLMTEVLAGRIDLSIAPLPGLVQKQIEAGNVRALALASATRTEFLPSLPTFTEAGVPGVTADAFGALFAPAKTPPAAIDRLYRAVVVAVGKDSVRTGAHNQGIPIVLRTPADMAAMLPGEVEKWANVVKLAQIPVE